RRVIAHPLCPGTDRKVGIRAFSLGRGDANAKKRREAGRDCLASRSYHGLLAVKGRAIARPAEAAGFALDRCARRDSALAGNPAPVQSQEPAMTTHGNMSSSATDHGTPVARRVADS